MAGNSAATSGGEALYLRFAVDAHFFAVPLEQVERVVRMVLISPLPLAPEVVEGLIDVAGEMLPVFNPRRRFHLPDRPVDLEDCLILVRAGKRRAALIADRVVGTESLRPREAGEHLSLPTPAVDGVAETADGLVIVQDLEQFLFPEEKQRLHDALRKHVRDEP